MIVLMIYVGIEAVLVVEHVAFVVAAVAVIVTSVVVCGRMYIAGSSGRHVRTRSYNSRNSKSPPQKNRAPAGIGRGDENPNTKFC